MVYDFPLITDCATGTYMIKAGMKTGESTYGFILNHPEVLKKLQTDCIDAGTNIILTPTFGVNKVKAGADYKASLKKLIPLTVETVRNSGKNVIVCGEISPCGLLMEPLGVASFDDIYNDFSDQTEAVAESDVDWIAFMTFYSLSEARIALLAANDATDKPVYVSMTVGKDARTMNGNDVSACAEILQKCGASVFGINCSTGPSDMLEAIKKAVLVSDIPVAAKPNAGTNTEHYLDPDGFSSECRRLLGAGASIIGGCCGTSPEHIKAIKTCSEESYRKPERPENKRYIATERSLHELRDDFRLSPSCGAKEFLDGFYDFDNDKYDIAAVEIKSEDDALLISGNSYMFDIPLCIRCGDPKILKLFARRYCGTFMTLGNAASCMLTEKYGTIII